MTEKKSDLLHDLSAKYFSGEYDVEKYQVSFRGVYRKDGCPAVDEYLGGWITLLGEMYETGLWSREHEKAFYALLREFNGSSLAAGMRYAYENGTPLHKLLNIEYDYPKALPTKLTR